MEGCPPWCNSLSGNLPVNMYELQRTGLRYHCIIVGNYWSIVCTVSWGWGVSGLRTLLCSDSCTHPVELKWYTYGDLHHIIESKTLADSAFGEDDVHPVVFLQTKNIWVRRNVCILINAWGQIEHRKGISANHDATISSKRWYVPRGYDY